MISTFSIAAIILLLLVVFPAFLAFLDEHHTPLQDIGRYRVANIYIHIIYNSRLAYLVWVLTSGKVYSFTLWSRVYVLTDRLSFPAKARMHELMHVAEWHDRGWHKAAWKYLTNLIRFGYVNHPSERVARTFAEESLGVV